MLEEAARVRALGDAVVERLLLAAIPDAHRVAAWILRDPVGAGGWGPGRVGIGNPDSITRRRHGTRGSARRTDRAGASRAD
jgi:hypothetical protein